MSAWLEDADVTLYHGDVLSTLRELPAESVDCVVTSPPYWGLRDYGISDQIGLEPTPEQYVERMVEVFREVRRVLAAHGTVWLNLGDSYASSPPGNTTKGVSAKSTLHGVNDPSGKYRDTLSQSVQTKRSTVVGDLKPKDLVGVPWRVAFALQADGWYLRSDIIWAKPNPMPESVTDRPTKAHEYVFLLSKQPRYFFDQEAVREPHESTRWGGKYSGPSEDWKNGSRIRERDDRDHYLNGGRNIRSVWEIATQPYPEAHFATFPEELARRCIAAGCPEQVCRVCQQPRTRITSTEYVKSPVHGAGSVVGRHYETGANNFDGAGMPRLNKEVTTEGFTDCGHADYRPGRVLDPFVGSGTVAYVARKLGRHAVGIDLSEEYLELAARRLQQQSLFSEV